MNRSDRGRVLALDVGLRRTGIALSDPSRTLASPLETVTLGARALARHVRSLIAEHEVEVVVIGQPELLRGGESAPADAAERLAEHLRSSGVEVVLWDETLTSWEAGEILRDRPRRSRRVAKEEIDRLAAALILQDYLDSMQRSGGRRPASAEAEAPEEGDEHL